MNLSSVRVSLGKQVRPVPFVRPAVRWVKEEPADDWQNEALLAIFQLYLTFQG